MPENPQTYGLNVRKRDKVAMFLLGSINNLPYVIGIASANRIVGQYKEPTYLGLSLAANTLSGLFARFINTWLASINVPYEVNFSINAAAMLAGLLGCAFSKVLWLSLICVFLFGFSSSFGESVLLCYITIRKKQNLLTSWSSGTGMAGILGAGYSLLCASISFNYMWSFIAVTPIVFIYIYCFFGIIRRSPEETINQEALLNNNLINSEEEKRRNESVSCFNFKILKPVWWFMFNCGAVYFLEYVIQSLYVHCSQNPKSTPKTYLYALLNLMYQIGVFISRSSLALFKFPWVGLLTLGQAVFFAVWATQPYFYWMKLWMMIIFMICVGLFGGCSYVNSFHLIMTNDQLTTKEKEMVTSWNAFFISLFIVFSAIFTFVSEQTYMKSKVPP
ncbi:CLN3 protein [Trichomonas vaginalis G3]|uniref:CLN3 protein n=1 Tax=Trichomonas vaginalis (strain ATCC PRA-98 / G3) TaxID=412133 RepID=A2FFJ5_TRIV3|nr:arginine transport [Trichomonas vaginalis G3]EAX96325.1 CLN3 protein [Trichomonas vaginalis G3]KAI5496372.1 arginine transport [Trichomonas vaginalis G3]|eukprot:XP_001309255.1 CLN3 protein [Trichomonas vaginalis G3]